MCIHYWIKQLEVAYTPNRSFSLRDFHRAVENLPTDAFIPQINDYVTVYGRGISRNNYFTGISVEYLLNWIWLLPDRCEIVGCFKWSSSILMGRWKCEEESDCTKRICTLWFGFPPGKDTYGWPFI